MPFRTVVISLMIGDIPLLMIGGHRQEENRGSGGRDPSAALGIYWIFARRHEPGEHPARLQDHLGGGHPAAAGNGACLLPVVLPFVLLLLPPLTLVRLLCP